MAVSGYQWVREYNAAVKLAEDITKMISESSSLPETGPETKRYSSTLRRKITILGTRVDVLQSSLSELPLTKKERNRRTKMVAKLRSNTHQTASTLNMSNFEERDSLLGPEIKPADAISRTTGLDSAGIVDLQRQIMKGQDDELDKLLETAISVKHVALAVGEELDLHERLIVDLDEHVEETGSGLQSVQGRLATLNKGEKADRSCLCLLLSVIGAVVLVAVICLLMKYL